MRGKGLATTLMGRKTLHRSQVPGERGVGFRTKLQIGEIVSVYLVRDEPRYTLLLADSTTTETTDLKLVPADGGCEECGHPLAEFPHEWDSPQGEVQCHLVCDGCSHKVADEMLPPLDRLLGTEGSFYSKPCADCGGRGEHKPGPGLHPYRESAR